MKTILKEFNEKWKGKVVNYCELIGNTLNFNPEGATFCCSSTTGNSPIVYETEELIEKGLSKELYVKAMIREFENNQSGCGKCVGCEKLKKIQFQEIDEETIKIESLIWNHFRGCNSACVYCSETHDFVKFYEPIEMVRNLQKESMLDTNLAVSFGGGEPTLLSNLEEYISFGVENGWRQILNTSALLYKNYIKDALANQKFSLQVSVDSGTFEVYKKVKGQSGYNIVWENIRKYCESKGKVFVKYIIFSYNSAKEEVDAFIEMCEQVGVDNVCISAEANAVWNLNKELPWVYGENEIQAMAYLSEKAMRADKAVYIYRGNLTEKVYGEAMKIFINNYLKSWIADRKLCIWGFGVNGKRLYDILINNCVPVSCFGDSYQVGKYDEIECLSLNEIKKRCKKDEICFLIAVNRYEKIHEELLKEFSINSVKILNVE